MYRDPSIYAYIAAINDLIAIEHEYTLRQYKLIGTINNKRKMKNKKSIGTGIQTLYSYSIRECHKHVANNLIHKMVYR